MSEASRPEVKTGRRIIRNGLRAGAAAVALTALSTAANVNPAAAADRTHQEQLTKAEKAERQAALRHAKEIQRALNKEGTYENARYYSGAQFTVKPEFQEKYAVGTIYHPLKLRGGTVGYVHYSGEGPDARVIVSFIDADHGTFTPGYGPVDMSTWKPEVEQTDLQLVNFDYTPDVANDPENTMRVVVANDEVQTFVGQYSGPVTVGPHQA